MKSNTTTEHETTIEDMNFYSRLAVAGRALGKILF